jgi:PAS domain S-box-containing protein/putative nucleotidyltransferase with HDIG domain
MSITAVCKASPVDWRSDPNLRQVEVVVCTTAGTFVGHTYRSSRLRLLDVLNKGFAARGVHIGMDYVTMTEVEMYLPEGGQKTIASIHISKASVLFVAERRGGQPKGDTSKSGRVIVAKKILDASLCLPPYVLVGRLHRAAWAELVTSLHQEETFMPLTKIQISPPLVTGESQFDFAAVNKDQVVYVADAAYYASDKPPVVRCFTPPSTCTTSVCPPVPLQPQMVTRDSLPLYPRRENPVIQPHREETDMIEESLQELLDNVANMVRSLQRDKSEVGAKSARNAAPDAEIPKDLAASGTTGDLSLAGKALPSAEEELQAILDSSGDGVVLVDAHHRILRINKTISEASGYSQQEVRGRPLDALISPQNLPRVSHLIQKSLCGLPTESLEMDACAGSDDKPPLKVQVSTLRKDDQIVGAAITTRKAADCKSEPDSRQPNEDRFRNLIENTSDWVWEIDAKRVYTYVSPKVKEILGYEPQEVLGKTISDLLPLREASHVTKRFAAATAAREAPKLMQIVCQHKDGRSVTLETSAVPVFDGEGRVCGYHGIHRDITGRDKTEQQSAQSTAKLERTMQGIIEAMTSAVEARDQYAVGHQQRVAKLANAIVWEMGHSPELAHAVRTAGLLHDVGKIFIPIGTLTKPGQLTQDEFATIKSHPGAGYEILKNIEFPWPIAEIVLQHHERMNGSGYPSGLKGDEIRLEARILGVADTVEAMLHPRSYRAALGMDKTLREIANDKGVLYDGDVVQACFSVFLDRGFKFQSE